MRLNEIHVLCLCIILFAVTTFNVKHLYGDKPMKREVKNNIIKSDFDLNTAVTGNVFKNEPKRSRLSLKLDSKLSLTRSMDECSLKIVSVVTTLNVDSKCIFQMAAISPVVVVGDVDTANSSSAFSRQTKGIYYLGIKEQENLYPELAKLIPYRSFARKNFGYLFALLNLSACFIFDFDDDNCIDDNAKLKSLLENPQALKKDMLWVNTDESSRIVNPYLLYGSPSFIWPRGYPLDEISKEIWPKFVKMPDPIQNEIELDIIQFIQKRDPDVDSVWRLLYGQRHLPMEWKMHDIMESHLLGILPTYVAPFNAQSTLLSRRAALFGFLPWTVHGRVSDIWRSFIMQYMILGFKNIGFLAFSGNTVSHKRNQHNYMGDFNGEKQLFDQTKGFLQFFDEKMSSVSENDIDEEYFEFFNGLYENGFLEAGDVLSIKIWIQYLSPLFEKTKVHNIKNSTSWMSVIMSNKMIHPKNVVGILHINHKHYRNIPLWMGLYRSRFKKNNNQHLRVYVPGLVPCVGLSGIDVHCISDDSSGFFAYESVVHSIQETTDILSSINGYLFMHDDVIWDGALEFDSMHTRITQLTTLRDLPAWDWINTEMGYTALNTFKTLSGSTIDMIAENMVFGQSDFFFISQNDASTFFKIASMMRKSNVFLEIAVPFLVKYFLDSNQISMPLLKIYTIWDASRNDRNAFFTRGCQSNIKYDYVHPIKLKVFDDFEASLYCY
jgi:STELLO glycosyltransferases